MNNKNFFYRNNYLSTLDLISKYNLKTVYNLPNLKSLKIEFNISELQQTLNSININELKTKIFIFLYLFNAIPLISIEKTKITKQKSSKEEELNFLISLGIKNRKNIENFLFFIFIESWPVLLKENISFNITTKNLNQKNFFFKATAPVFAFKFFENILNDKNIFDLNTKELNCDLSFFIKKGGISKSSNKNILHNIFPFFLIK